MAKGNLVLSRAQGQSISIGQFDEVVITFIKTGKNVRVSIQAPKNIPVRRSELPTQKQIARPLGATKLSDR